MVVVVVVPYALVDEDIATRLFIVNCMCLEARPHNCERRRLDVAITVDFGFKLCGPTS
jgi:hypothetical protein